MKFNNVEHEVIFKKLMSHINANNQAALFEVSGDVSELDEINRNISIMHQTKDNYDHRPITSHRKFIGPAIVFGKKVARKFLKWYIRPIVVQQTEFNHAATTSINRITNKLSEQESKIREGFDETNRRFNEFESQTSMAVLETSRKFNEYDDLLKKIENKIVFLEEQNQRKDALIEQLAKELEFSIFNKRTYAQAGEDSILAYMVHVLGLSFDSISYLDLGANHAKEMSNTYFFYSRGAKGILVEANPMLIPELKQYRNRDIILNYCIDVESGKNVDFYILNGDGLSTPDYETAKAFCERNPDLKIIDKISIETISYRDIVKKFLGKAPTILSIDIEGKDLEIIKSIDFENDRPVIIVIEMIEYDPLNLAYQSKNQEIIKFLKAKDYDEYAFTGINSIFVDKQYLHSKRGDKQ
ncbi:FkbM family methyltransferase [Cohnella laeviribosi]|uniref:FkbM family methyltransferase n=1 Tax=Cohnella laeviribosi TaxID=380174 RepID=UPI00036B748A|nr:FkbM family methyltransferase [Cohnella laeviribosi]